MRFLLSFVALVGIAAGQTPNCAVSVWRDNKAISSFPCSSCTSTSIVCRIGKPVWADLLPLPEPLPPRVWNFGPAEEPVDVPAIQEPAESLPDWGIGCQDCVGCTNGGHFDDKPIENTPQNHWPGVCVGGHKTTCADKSRGLWHDEATPPKYWCRKAQPWGCGNPVDQGFNFPLDSHRTAW